MKPKAKASILVVEDDPAIQNGLVDVLIFNGYSAVGIAEGDTGLKQGLEKTWDLIVLDVMLPKMDGYTICREIRKAKPDQGIIMLTAKGAEDDMVKGFKSGADDYVSKPFSIRELMVRVEAVLRRSGKLSDETPVFIHGIEFDGANLLATANGKSIELTRREMDIIFYFYTHGKRIITKKELLSNVWEYANPDIETRTVDIHMLKLRKKIALLAGKETIIRTIRGEGYKLEPCKRSQGTASALLPGT